LSSQKKLNIAFKIMEGAKWDLRVFLQYKAAWKHSEDKCEGAHVV
jgi:hypothetical protein